MIQSWIIRHLQIIGEAARALSETIQQSHPEIPWSKVIGMRNILVHDYFGIDKDIVWNVIEHELPKLKPQINAIVQKSK